MMSRAALAALLILLGARGFAFAGDPATEESRLRVEDAFLDGRLDDVKALESVDDYPSFLLGSWWRPEGLHWSGKESDLGGRRYGWDGGEAYPLPDPGEADPHPRLTALVLDRMRRERLGARGLPDESPLAAIREERVQWFVKSVMRPAFLGTAAADWTAEERERQGLIRDAASRNLWIAMGAVAALLLAAGAALWIARPRPSPPAA